MEKFDQTYKIQIDNRIFTVTKKELEGIKNKGVKFTVLKTSRLD